MLKSIVIKNLALIEQAELEFGEGLNVLSGETGAGKSIIVDAIMLLLGAKYDKSLLRFGAQSGFVEGVFELTPSAREILADMGYDDEDEVVICRRFFVDGKNDVRVNGRAATASMVKRLTEKLVDIYGQHEYVSVAKACEQGRLFDYYIRENISCELSALEEKVSKYNEVCSKLDSIGTSGDRERLIDVLKYQIDEIEKAKVKRGEEDELTSKRKIIASAEKINTALSTTLNALSESEICAMSQIEQAQSALGSISQLGYESLYERIVALKYELSDIAESVRDELDRDFDVTDLDKIEQRLQTIKNLRKKYGDFDQMTEFFDESSKRLYELENSDKIYAKLTAEKKKLLDEIYTLSLKISEIRKQKAVKFEQEIERHLSELGMESVKFKVNFAPFALREDCEKYVSPRGMDKIEFYFSPNKGQPLAPMTKIISGGEMSRFMLALKVVNGEKDDIPTMIFDEIDVGISGTTGRAVAQKLMQIALGHQVLCVTHLPQIAAMASEQFFIEKSVVGEQTYTNVTKLSDSGMIKEIARLSGGLGVTSQAETAAAELKKWCDDYKKSLS
ncbi:MAG: DNA repair protein RecN [Clostridia bacterium]|nr:DNA repair protein RecN [Clostridia bacterium]